MALRPTIHNDFCGGAKPMCRRPWPCQFRYSFAVLGGIFICSCGAQLMSDRLKDFGTAFDASLQLQTKSLPAATMGQVYVQPLKAQGQPKPFKWRVIGGSLPSGIELGKNGVLRGIATSPGVSSFIVEVSCETSPAVDDDARAPYVCSRAGQLSLVVRGETSLRSETTPELPASGPASRR
jgi:hypothetical protein